MDVLCMLLGDWDTLVVVLGRQADNEFDIEQKSALWRRIGAIKGDMLGDVDGAIDAFEQALELESDSLEALDRLIQLYAPRDASRMVALLEQRVESTPAEADDERHQLMVHAATVHEEQLDDRISAIAMLQRALDARPNDVSILSSLERLFHAEEAWDDLLDNLRTQADTTAESERRIELRNKIGDLSSSQYDDSIGALEQYRLVLDEVTDNAHALAATRKIGDEHEELRLEVAALLEPVLTELERHRELVEVMDMRFKAQQDPAERSQTLSSMSMLLEEQLDDAPGARDAILGALAETPEQASLHEDAARLCELTGQWQRYAEVLGTGANDSFDGELQVDLYRRLGRVCEERLDDQEGAIEAYKGALELSEEPAELLEALDRLYSSTGNTEQLVMVIQRRIDFDDSDAERAELHYRLATIQIQGLEDPVQGLATLQHVVELVPEHEGAREQLEALTENEELFEQVADVLDNVYRVMQDSAARAQLQSKRIGYTSDPQERLSQRLALAQMLESEAFDTVSAQRVIEQAIADAPQNVSLLDHLERLAEENAAGRDGPVAWRNAGAAVTNAVELGLESSDDASSIGAVRAHTLLVKVAGWLQDNADDVEGAEKALNQALQHNESSGQALSMLEAIQRDTGRERDLVATLLRMAALVQVGEADADRSANELRREAKIIAETALEDAVLAETIVRDMIRINDADVWALSELSSLLEAKGDHRELSDLLLRRIELCEHEDELRDLRHHAAIVASEKLGDDDAAIDLYEQAFEDDVSDSIAKEALRELYEKLERHSDMLRLLERLTDASEAPDERAQLRYQSAIICLDTLEAPTEGIEHLRAVLEEDQGHQDAVMRLSQVLENEGMDDQLAELLGRQIEVTRERGDEEAELGFRVKTAELYESRLNDPEKAIDAYVGILELDSDHRPALTALARLHEGQDSYAEAAAMYEKLLESAEADDVPRLAMKVRDLYVTGELPEEACRVVEAVLDRGEAIDGDAIGQLRDGLKSLYRTREAWDELAAIIAVEAGEAESDDERVELYRKAADIHSTKRDDHAAAAELLEKALALKEDDRDLMLAVCDEYTASGRGQAVVEMLQRIVDSFGGRRSKELADIHHRIASAYLADDNEALALSELELARKMDPGSVRILYQLGKLSLRMADADDGAAAEHLKRAGNNFRSLLLQKLAADSLVTKAQVFLHLAQVNEREGDRKKAIQMLERALSNDKNFEPAQQYLDELRG